MKLELQHFTYFSKIHLYSFVVSILFSVILLLVPKLFRKKSHMRKNIRNYATFLGFFILFFKIVDSTFRYYLHHEPLANVLLVHLCNFAAVFAGLYLILKTRTLFNITYFLSFGAAFALVLPGVTFYYHPSYVYIFMIMHALEFVAVVYGFVYLKEKITFSGFVISIVTLLTLFLYAHFYNNIFKADKINAMFLNDYIAPMVRFIEPFWLYQIVLIVSMCFIMLLMYLPFSRKKKLKHNGYPYRFK